MLFFLESIKILVMVLPSKSLCSRLILSQPFFFGFCCLLLYRTNQDLRFVGFAGSNDRKHFYNLTGITLVETRRDACITEVNPNGDPNAMAYLDMQLVVHKTWAEELAGYNVMKRDDNMPGLAAAAIACGSTENTFKQLAGILVTVIEEAGTGPVRGMDELLLDLFEETRRVEYFEELLRSNRIDQQIFKSIHFGEGAGQKMLRGETATPQTCAMSALKSGTKVLVRRTIMKF